MSTFENNFILKEKPYKYLLVPRIPDFRVDSVAVILTGAGKSIVVDGRTTCRQIREGGYTHLVEISTKSYGHDICLNTSARERAYKFDVYIRVDIHVSNALDFYRNKGTDVNTYIQNQLYLDVNKITENYSILDYKGMDDELAKKLLDETITDIGIAYKVSAIRVEPNAEAKEVIKQDSRQQINAALQKRAIELIGQIPLDYNKAVIAGVIGGDPSLEQGIKKIEEHQDGRFEKEVQKTDDLVRRGYMTESQAGEHIRAGLRPAEQKRLDNPSESPPSPDQDDGMDTFYPGG